MHALKLGQYDIFQVDKDNECAIDNIKKGDIFYTIRMEGGGYYDTKEQDVAEILSRLVRIEQMLKPQKRK